MKNILLSITIILCACNKQGNHNPYLYTEIYEDGSEAPTETLHAESDSMAVTIALDKYLESYFKTRDYNNSATTPKTLPDLFRLTNETGQDLYDNNIGITYYKAVAQYYSKYKEQYNISDS